MQQAELIERIKELKRKRNAVILAHYYSRPEVQDIADFVGDSLGLSQEAVRQTADVIVFFAVSILWEKALQFSVRTKQSSCRKLMPPAQWLIW